MIKCIVIDDEPYARNLLEDFIQKVPDLSFEGSYSSALKAIDVIRKRHIDVIFLDIQMPDITGIDFLKTLDKRPNIIFTTAYAEYALEGFELDAVDYLLKPFDFQRFLKAVNKIGARVSEQGTKSIVTNTAAESILIKDGTKHVKVNLRDILFIKGLREYVTIHTTEKKIMSLQAMKNLEQELPDYFVRVHNSYIISMHAIESVGKTELEIGGEVIPIGITYKKIFEEKLQKFFPGRIM